MARGRATRIARRGSSASSRPPVSTGVARDVDFLLTVTCVVGVAAAVELPDVAREGAAALEPYAGRGVINAGAVTFHGVVDDYIYRAASCPR